TSLKSAARREQYVSKLKMGAEPGGWQFLVGQRKSIDGLAQSLGFQYYYDEKQDQYAHPAVVFILTSEGIISRYLFGIEFRGRDLKLALLEAADEKVSSTFEKLILYCFHYDTDAQGYVLMAANVMKLGGAVTLFFVVITLGLFWIRERTRPNPATQKAKN
nr:SCO family protein [FCB group bacterium]